MAWKVAGYVPFNRQVYWKFLYKYKQKAETIIITMGQSNLIYKASMTLISASGGNTAGFLRNMRGERGYFRRMTKMKNQNTGWKRGGGTRAKIRGHTL